MAPITGTNNGDVLFGSAGDDTITGLGGNDTLLGLDGNDLLDGGTGNCGRDSAGRRRPEPGYCSRFPGLIGDPATIY